MVLSQTVWFSRVDMESRGRDICLRSVLEEEKPAARGDVCLYLRVVARSARGDSADDRSLSPPAALSGSSTVHLIGSESLDCRIKREGSITPQHWSENKCRVKSKL